MEKNKYNLLLMTRTIKPNSGILNQGYSKTININERLNQYIETILYYLSISNINGIVFIDNSNYDLDVNITDSLFNIAKNLGKDIEFLKFQGNVENQLKYTYGYGEFETLDFLYHNSLLLKKTESVYKSTGRYKIYNIGDLIKESINLDNIFYKYNLFNFSGLNTAFFKISNKNIYKVISEYNNVFIESFGSKIKLGSEEIMFKILGGEKLNSIRIYPFFYNIGNFKYLFYQFLTKIGFFDLNSVIFKILKSISYIIPIFIKIYFNKFLGYLLKFFKK